MSQRTQDIRADADWLSLDYLIAECIWDPKKIGSVSAASAGNGDFSMWD